MTHSHPSDADRTADVRAANRERTQAAKAVIDMARKLNGLADAPACAALSKLPTYLDDLGDLLQQYDAAEDAYDRAEVAERLHAVFEARPRRVPVTLGPQTEQERAAAETLAKLFDEVIAQHNHEVPDEAPESDEIPDEVADTGSDMPPVPDAAPEPAQSGSAPHPREMRCGYHKMTHTPERCREILNLDRPPTLSVDATQQPVAEQDRPATPREYPCGLHGKVHDTAECARMSAGTWTPEPVSPTLLSMDRDRSGEPVNG